MKKIISDLPLIVSHEIQVYLPENPKRVFLLLHGYLLDGQFMFDHFSGRLPEDCAVIAPNGPFMVPVKKKESFQPRFAWYFFDTYKKEYYINFEPAAKFLKSTLERLDLLSLPTTVIGYSQGGYLAPKLAELLPCVDSVIGIACSFRNKRFTFKEHVKIHQINSEDDLVVDFSDAKQEFETLSERGNLGIFVSLKGVGHRLDDCYLNEVQSVLGIERSCTSYYFWKGP